MIQEGTVMAFTETPEVGHSRKSQRRMGHSFQTLGITALIGWTGIIVMLLGMSDPLGQSLSSTFVGSQAALQLGHFFLFGVLGLLIASGALAVTNSKRLAVALIAGLLVGGAAAVLTESYQSTVSGRSGNLEDILTNVIGTASGALFAWIMRIWLTRRSPAVEPEPYLVAIDRRTAGNLVGTIS